MPRPLNTSERPDAAPLRPVEWLLVAAVWAFYGVMTIATQFVDRSGGPPFDRGGPSALQLFVNPAVWAVMTALILWVSRFVTLDQTFWRRRGLLVLIAGILVANVFDLAADALWDALAPAQSFGPGPGGKRFAPGFDNLSWLDDLGVLLAAAAVATARGYILREQARREEARRRAAESEARSVHIQAHAAQLQAQLAEARLDALRRQLDPHFLFNTLNTVSALVERDPHGVRRMIGQLSDLLRHSIDSASAPEIPLRRELELLQRYVDIMRVRFEGQLEITVQADPSTLDALVPNLILQPLVENAIKHGVEQRSHGGRVAIEAKLEGDNVVLRVRDNGPGMSPWSAGTLDASAESSDARRGVGLRNTATRLGELYGDNYSFTVGPNSSDGTLAEVRLPYHVAGVTRGG